MSIQNLPASLQGAIQQNLLYTEFEQSLRSILMYRSVAQREKFAIQAGETQTKTRAGLKPAITSPLNPQTNTNLDNGLTPSSYSIEQYVMAINQYADTIDLNRVTSRVAIASIFLQNAKNNGAQAAQTMDGLARDNLFAAYLSGNTRVVTTLGAPAATIAVDDIRGFSQVINAAGQLVYVNASNTMPVTIGDNVYSLISSAPDAVNVSTARAILDANGKTVSGVGGISGTLTFSSNVSVSDATAGNPVVGGYAPAILRPNNRSTTSLLTTGDALTMSILLDAVALLRNNAVPTIDGKYHCFLDPQSMRQLYADPEFQLLYRGRGMSDPVYENAQVVEGLDLRFFPTTQAPQQLQTGAAGRAIRRPIVCGAEVLVEGTFEGQEDVVIDSMRGNSYIEMIDDVIQVVRPPIDRLDQIIAQSWFWIGGYAVPTDATANRSTIPTASNAYQKRAVVIETV